MSFEIQVVGFLNRHPFIFSSRNGKNKYVIDSESDTTDMDEEAPKPKKQATFDDIFGKPNGAS